MPVTDNLFEPEWLTSLVLNGLIVNNFQDLFDKNATMQIFGNNLQLRSREANTSAKAKHICNDEHAKEGHTCTHTCIHIKLTPTSNVIRFSFEQVCKASIHGKTKGISGASRSIQVDWIPGCTFGGTRGPLCILSHGTFHHTEEAVDACMRALQ